MHGNIIGISYGISLHTKDIPFVSDFQRSDGSEFNKGIQNQNMTWSFLWQRGCTLETRLFGTCFSKHRYYITQLLQMVSYRRESSLSKKESVIWFTTTGQPVVRAKFVDHSPNSMAEVRGKRTKLVKQLKLHREGLKEITESKKAWSETRPLDYKQSTEKWNVQNSLALHHYDTKTQTFSIMWWLFVKGHSLT